MIHFYVLQGKYVNVAYYRDSDLAGGSFSLPFESQFFRDFTFSYGTLPWPVFFENHADYKTLFSAPENYTPQQFIQDYPELFL